MTGAVHPWEDARVLSGLAIQHESRRQSIASGARQIGWKVAFGAPASLELMQIAGPFLGYLTDATELPSGATVDVSHWDRAVVEFELAVRLGRDVGPEADSAEAAAAVDALAPAIELANVNLSIGPESVREIVAGNVFHTGFILGDWDETRAGLDIDGLAASIAIDGVEMARIADLQALTGLYPDVVSSVAKTLHATGEGLSAGDVIITGSVVPPVSAGEGSLFSFTLEPFKSISVTMTS